MLVTQAEFAKMKSVTPAAVSQWKSEDRLVVVGKKIDVEATEERLLRESRFHSKRIKPALNLNMKPPELNDGNVKYPDIRAPIVKRVGPWDDAVPVAAIDGLPNVAHDYAIATETGADDIALLLLRTGMSEEAVLAVVRAWVALQRKGWLEVLDDELDPPYGAASWAECALFTSPWPNEATSPWSEIVAEATYGAG